MAAGLRVLVAGAGLGGLTAALALRRAGFAVEIFEQASTLGDVGAGIQIAPNAVKVLRALGLEEPLADVAVRPLALEGRDWASGAVLQSFALDEAYVTRYGAPYFHVHRADLHQVLLDGVRQVGDIPIHLDAKVEAMAEDGDKVTILTSDGHETVGDVLVGADGIHSSVRAHLFGPDNPHFTGTVAFRTTIPIERLPADFVSPKGYNWMGPHHHFVHYYLRRGELMNCVGVCEMPDWRVESWVEPGDIAEFRAEFDGWHEIVQTMIDAAERCWKWALYDRDPLERWSVGRITLLGDAAHPMLPFLAQGACMGMPLESGPGGGIRVHEDDVAVIVRNRSDPVTVEGGIDDGEFRVVGDLEARHDLDPLRQVESDQQQLDRHPVVFQTPLVPGRHLPGNLLQLPASIAPLDEADPAGSQGDQCEESPVGFLGDLGVGARLELQRRDVVRCETGLHLVNVENAVVE